VEHHLRAEHVLEEAKGLLSPGVDESALPGSLLARLGEPSAGTLTRLLRLISPVTTTSCEARIVMPV
jgi:hypothetical protein